MKEQKVQLACATLAYVFEQYKRNKTKGIIYFSSPGEKGAIISFHGGVIKVSAWTWNSSKQLLSALSEIVIVKWRLPERISNFKSQFLDLLDGPRTL